MLTLLQNQEPTKDAKLALLESTIYQSFPKKRARIGLYCMLISQRFYSLLTVFIATPDYSYRHSCWEQVI